MTGKEMFDLSGKVAIVTGGRGLYGSSMSEGLAEVGATVIVASRDGEKCEEYAKTLRDRGLEAYGYALDLGSDESIKALVDQVAERFGRIDILVNNAVTRFGPCDIENLTREELSRTYDINIIGQCVLTKFVYPYMEKQNWGSIINISSIRGLDSPHFPFYADKRFTQASYCIEKSGLIGFTRWLAGRAGGNNIRCNAICPGGYNPNLAPDDPFVETYKTHNMLNRWAEKDDIKGPVIFLASEASRYVTGSTIVMDGGWTVW